MGIFNILIEWDWCSQPEVIKVFDLIKSVVDIIRYIVPIVLIVLTTMDILHHVLDPNSKDGQQKIMYRLIASVIIFFIPVIISFAFNVIDLGIGYTDSNAGLKACWR